MPIYGIDVSKWQGSIDWARVARSGIKFAIARASIGTVTDAWYAVNARGMRANGIIPGAYHFLEPARVVSPEAQADKFMSLIGNPEGMLVVLDVEKDGSNYPGITDVDRWVDRFRAKYPNHPLLIYTGKWYWAGSSYPIKNANGSRYGKLWHSHYVSATGASPATLYQSVTSGMWDPDYGGWQEATFLQFTSSSSVPGVSGRCDANAFRGSLDELRAFTTSQSSPEETVRSFSVPAKASVAVIRDGAWLYDNDGLDPSESNINIDGAREMPLLGTLPGTVRIVEYVRSDGTRSGKAYFVKPEHVSTVREAPASEPVDCTAAVAAATAPLNEQVVALNAEVVDLTTRLATEVEAARAEEQDKAELAVTQARAEEQAACADLRADLSAVVDAHRTIGRVVAENPE